MKQIIGVAFIFSVSGCGTLPTTLPATLGEEASGHSYIPLDGLAISTDFGDSCYKWENGVQVEEKDPNKKPKPLLEALPDINVRFSVASIDSGGVLSFGPAQITAKGSAYKAVLDYVNVDTPSVKMWITAFVDKNKGKEGAAVEIEAAKYSQTSREDIVAYNALSFLNENNEVNEAPYSGASELVTIPVYVGIGVRVTAFIRAIESGVSISGLSAIGLAAQNNSLTGTLTVQTIGISGESISIGLPLPSKLDQTTVENALMSIGAVRASIYKNPNLTPRLVGIYSPFGSDPALINAIYLQMAETRPVWFRPCQPKPR